MATITNSVSIPIRGVSVLTWASLAANDRGSAEIVGHYNTKSVQIHGAFSNATVILEGSNVPGGAGEYHTLNDADGNAISITTDSDSASYMREVRDHALYMRPRVANGDVETNVTVRLFLSTER